jgi:hypothetical protein
MMWLKTHERLLACVLIVALVLFLGNKWLNNSAAEADARAQAAQSVLEAQKKANDQTAAQVAQAQAQFQVLIGQVNSQNAKLTGEILQLSQALAARQKVDAALPLPDLALRQEALLGVSTGIQAAPGGLLVSPSASVQTVQALEQLPVLKQSLADETTVADNRAKALDSQTQVVVGLQSQVSGLSLQIGDGQKVCDARLAAVKADARKGKRNWFLRGLAVGGAAVGYALFHI